MEAAEWPGAVPVDEEPGYDLELVEVVEEPDGQGEEIGARATLEKVIATLNAKHLVGSVQGATVIASLESDADQSRERLVFTRPADLRLLYQNRHVVVGDKTKSWANAWLSHPDRRTFDRIALIPAGTVPSDTYNLWRGWGVEPKVGDWSTIQSHLLNVICCGDEESYQWLLLWIARCVQHPELRAEVAIVLRGKKGAGKGVVAQMLLRLFRHHGLHISNSRHLLGNFNQHLLDALFLFCDEAFWAGDKQGEGVLKALITEPTLMIEPKYVNAFSVPNRLKIMTASNAEWVVPATADERRFFVLDVPESKCGDRAYFERLFGTIEGPELPALLHDLLALDLTGFDHRTAPHTHALNRQKLVGGDSFGKFWLDCLNNGEIVLTVQEAPRATDVSGSHEDGLLDDGWPNDMVCQVFHHRYVEHAKRHGERHPITDAEVGKKLSEFIPDLKTKRPRKPWGDCSRPKRYLLPDLATCRTAFLKKMNILDHEWPQEDHT